MAGSGSFADIEAETPYPGIVRRTFHSERMTFSEYTFAPGATFPLHRHTQEQVTLIEAGEVRLTAGGATGTFAAGAWSVMPAGVDTRAPTRVSLIDGGRSELAARSEGGQRWARRRLARVPIVARPSRPGRPTARNTTPPELKTRRSVTRRPSGGPIARPVDAVLGDPRGTVTT